MLSRYFISQIAFSAVEWRINYMVTHITYIKKDRIMC